MASHSLHRPVTFARRGMVVAPHYLADEAGMELLKTGGNALDAAVAASAMLQVVYPFVCGLGIQAAIEMPRWIHGAENGAAMLRVESRLPPETLQALRQRGHPVEELGVWETGMGYAQGITFDPSAGVMQGGADPRAESLAAAW